MRVINSVVQNDNLCTRCFKAENTGGSEYCRPCLNRVERIDAIIDKMGGEPRLPCNSIPAPTDSRGGVPLSHLMLKSFEYQSQHRTTKLAKALLEE